MNAERAAGPARRAPVSGHKNFFWPTIPIRAQPQVEKNKKKNKATSSQAPKRVGPPNKVKGSKQG